jgi:hypothetical protein
MASDTVVNALLIVLACAVLWWLMNSYSSKQTSNQVERFYADAVAKQAASKNPSDLELPYNGPQVPQTYKATVGEANNVIPAEEEEVGEFRAIDYDTKQVAGNCFPRDRLTATDLLPKDAANSKWSMVAPSGQGDIMDQNFLTAGHQIGVNTQGSSLRNANLQLRRDPVISREKGGFGILESTIEPDLVRRPLDPDF